MALRRILVLALLAVAAATLVTAAGSEPARAAQPQKLFALDAERGALTPLQGKRGYYRLVLEEVRGRAIYFTDRPARKVGTVAVRPMLRDLFAGDSPAPNAAVNATAAKRGQLLMGVEIRAWRYHARQRKLTLRVRHLKQGGRTLAQLREDVVLPRSFRDVSVFIDDCCGVAVPATAFNPGQFDLTLSINNGPAVELPGASPESWLPGSAPIGFEPSGPQPGVLGPGANYLAVTPEGASTPLTVSIQLPGNVLYDSLQLYLFVVDSAVTWAVLDNGRLIASAAAAMGA